MGFKQPSSPVEKAASVGHPATYDMYCGAYLEHREPHTFDALTELSHCSAKACSRQRLVEAALLQKCVEQCPARPNPKGKCQP
jgi:hypothetical protein